MKLFKHLLMCLFILTILGSSTSCAKVIKPANKISNNASAFVQIFHTTKIISCTQGAENCPIGEFTQTGSGIKIDLIKSENMVLTAGHVCDTQPSKEIQKSIQTIAVRDTKENLHQAWPIRTTFYRPEIKTGDLCLLWVPTLKHTKGAKFSFNVKPEVGDDIYYLGAPKGVFHPPTVPIFRGVYSGILDQSSSIITAPAIGGSSGGPVFNKHHKIIGVVFAANPEFHHITLMVNYDILKSFLSESKKDFKKISN